MIVNLFGQPCAGKSTVRADVFRCLKQRGVNCEEVYETAKKLSWTGRTKELASQPYIAVKQLRDLEVLQGRVDVIITDSPLLLCEFYNRKYRADHYPASFGQFVIEQFRAMGGVNYFLTPAGRYMEAGRNQTEAEAELIGLELRALLDENGFVYDVLRGDEKAGPRIADAVYKLL